MEGEVSVILHVHRNSLRDAPYTRLRACRRAEWNDIGMPEFKTVPGHASKVLREFTATTDVTREWQSSRESFVRVIRKMMYY